MAYRGLCCEVDASLGATSIPHAAPSRPWPDIVWAGVLALLIDVLYYGSPRSSLLLVLVAIAGIVLFGRKHTAMQAADWIVVLAFGFEGVSSILSQDRANSSHGLGIVAISVFLYFVIRLTIISAPQMAILAGILAAGALYLSVFGMERFVMNASALREAGFSDLLPFRAQLIPVRAPWVTGEWLTLLLMGLPFACAVPAWFLLSKKNSFGIAASALPILLSATLCLSLSRAVFFGILFFYVLLFALLAVYGVVKVRTGVLLLISALTVIAVLLFSEGALFPGVAKAYFSGETSQTRSAEGRIGIWKRSLEAVRLHPWTGVGASNGPLALTSTANSQTDAGFASSTFSLPVQILLEKGCIGLLVYGSFLFLAARSFVTEMQTVHDPGMRVVRCCFASGILAVLARELAYSSLFAHTITLAVFFALIALISATRSRMPQCE